MNVNMLSMMTREQQQQLIMDWKTMTRTPAFSTLRSKLSPILMQKMTQDNAQDLAEWINSVGGTKEHYDWKSILRWTYWAETFKEEMTQDQYELIMGPWAPIQTSSTVKLC